MESSSGPVDREFVVGLPKAEVHLHLEGCLPAELVAAAAARHGTSLHPAIAGGRPRVTNLPELLSYLDWACALVDRPEQLTAIAYETARRVTASGTRHIDVIVNPTHWPRWFGRLAPMLEALDAGFEAAESDGYATATVCFSVARSQDREAALELVDWMLEVEHPRISALSIDGDESRGSFTANFRDAFARAAEGGLHRCAHAGESSGPQGVREAVDLLGAERIDHGVRSLESPELVAELAARRIPLDVCPTSNLVLGIARDWPSHPVERLRQAGVRVSLNTDDPAIYGIDLVDEFLRGAETFGWTRRQVVALARTSIEASFAGPARRQALLAELATLAGEAVAGESGAGEGEFGEAGASEVGAGDARPVGGQPVVDASAGDLVRDGGDGETPA